MRLTDPGDHEWRGFGRPQAVLTAAASWLTSPAGRASRPLTHPPLRFPAPLAAPPQALAISAAGAPASAILRTAGQPGTAQGLGHGATAAPPGIATSRTTTAANRTAATSRTATAANRTATAASRTATTSRTGVGLRAVSRPIPPTRFPPRTPVSLPVTGPRLRPGPRPRLRLGPSLRPGPGPRPGPWPRPRPRPRPGPWPRPRPGPGPRRPLRGPAAVARLGVEPQGERDPLAGLVDAEHLHPHHVTGLGHLARIGDEVPRQDRHVHQAVLMHADVDERAERRDVGDHSLQDHAGRQVRERLHALGERRRREGRTRVAARLLQL